MEAAEVKSKPKRKIKRIAIKKQAFTSIPQGIINGIKGCKLPEEYELEAFTFVDWLIKTSIFQSGKCSSYVQVHARSKFKTGYKNNWLDALLESEVLITDGQYRTSNNKEGKKPKCICYKVNYDLVHNPNTLGKAKSEFELNPKLIQTPIYKGFVWSANKLEYPIKLLEAKLTQLVDDISIGDFNVDGQIAKGVYKVKFPTTNEYDNDELNYYDSDWAIDYAKSEELSAIEDDGTIYIKSVEKFLTDKKKAVQVSNQRAIEKLANRHWHTTDRNETNQRLDSPFTNLNKELFEIIKRHNGLRELDAKNSQYSLLANMMGEQTDLAFYDIATMGMLYEQLALAIDPSIPKVAFHKLKATEEQWAAGQKARKKAKLLMMLLVFGKVKSKVPYIDVFRQLFPEAYEWISWYKTENPYKVRSNTINGDSDFYKALPIALQRMESKFWVDGVLKQCYKKRGENRIVAISRHDSISVFAKDRDTVHSIIDEQKKNNGYKFSLSK
ncbi:MULTISPECIES: hypothetical protein [Flavobacteriaceae]|uniref:hypothetical protein n=1 Tax=Flavobacteriaceae TaxID=49546 RepID=UPI00149131C7|nr:MULTISPECIES: hypothetical protein [Allomuricauda]MDC6364818.1 hypothetical protein [Muricauda sp. AC10]